MFGFLSLPKAPVNQSVNQNETEVQKTLPGVNKFNFTCETV